MTAAPQIEFPSLNMPRAVEAVPANKESEERPGAFPTMLRGRLAGVPVADHLRRCCGSQMFPPISKSFLENWRTPDSPSRPSKTRLGRTSSGCVLLDLRNESVSLNVELYSNQHNLLALIRTATTRDSPSATDHCSRRQVCLASICPSHLRRDLVSFITHACASLAALLDVQSVMSPDKRSRQQAKKKKAKGDVVRIQAKPSSDDVHEIVFFKRHRDDDADETIPGRVFLKETCPAKVRATMNAALIAVAAAPPKRFAGGGYWEAMKGEMAGWFEVRVDGPDRHHYRLFCRLDYEAKNIAKPLLVVVTGLDKPFRTTLTAADYARVRSLGDEYFARSPRSVG